MNFRLGIDVGTNSIGLCALELDSDEEPIGILHVSVRIFPDSRDPKSGTSLASERRVPRGMRRRRDRYLKRRERLMNALIRHRLMPEDEDARKALEKLDPYELRARGLDGPLEPHELGRAIFHLNQRRGFKSNRKTDATDKESGDLKKAISELRRRMDESGAKTLGQYLHRRLRKKKTARARPGVGIYPSRDMIEDEFDILWAKQRAHHPALLTDAARSETRDALTFQRPLRPVEPGNCELDPDDKRAPLALPLSQRFRMYQELNNLRIIRPDGTERRLDLAERDTLFGKLQRQKTLSFNAMRKALKLDSEARFNLEDEKRKALNGDKTGTLLAVKDAFGARWHKLGDTEQDAVAEAILAAEDEDSLTAYLKIEWNLPPDAARRAAGIQLIDGYGRIGRKAMRAIVPIMRDQGLSYIEAAAEAGYEPSDRRPETLSKRLPYYGAALNRYTAGGTGKPENDDEKQFGKLANPTVHVALNQLRKAINAMINRYGPPAEIVVELARDLKIGELRKTDIRLEQAANARRNERVADELRALGQKVTGANIRRYKLWEEQGPVHERRCPYTGRVISGEMLFTPEVEIEHILPFRRSLDDSMANRILSFVSANRDKGNQSPHEAFSHNPPGYDYDAILARAQSLPRNKAWRFAPDAMEKLEKDGDFIARQLTDTAYLARVTRQYLTHICPANKVHVVPGRLTALLRGKWGLNSLLSDANLKSRLDHRHHAIDAFTVGVTDRGMLQRVARAADDNRERVIDDMPVPWDGFRDELRDKLNNLTVSHKPDHGAEGRLHEETAYGLVADPAREDGFNLVYRKSFADLNPNEAARIRDLALRQRVLDALYEAEGAGVKPREALAAFAKETGIRRVRLLKKEAGTIPIAGPNGKPYKAYSPGDNHCIDIFALPNGRWAGEALTVFQANQKMHRPAWKRDNPDASFVMRVHKGDLIKMEHDGEEQVMRVVKLNPSSDRLWLCGHADGGDLQKRHNDPGDKFRWALVSYNRLRQRGARKVHVDAIGRVRDPGPPS